MEKCLQAVKDSVCSEPITICTYENLDGGWVKAFQNLIEGLSDHAVIFNIGDDVIIKPDCIQKLWDAFVVERDGMSSAGMYDKPLLLQPYEQVHRGNLCTNPFTEAWVIKKYLNKGYIHNFADNDLTGAVRLYGRYVYVPDAITEHVHFELDRNLYDKTYDMTQRHYFTDQALFHRRSKEKFLPFNE